MGITLENQELEITKYIKISPDKFLITCGENSYLRKPFSVCKQTIYNYVQATQYLFVGEAKYHANDVIPRNGKTCIQESFFMADSRRRLKLPPIGRMCVQDGT